MGLRLLYKYIKSCTGDIIVEAKVSIRTKEHNRRRKGRVVGYEETGLLYYYIIYLHVKITRCGNGPKPVRMGVSLTLFASDFWDSFPLIEFPGPFLIR